MEVSISLKLSLSKIMSWISGGRAVRLLLVGFLRQEIMRIISLGSQKYCKALWRSLVDIPKEHFVDVCSVRS